MTQLRTEYQVYLQNLEEKSTHFIYDEDGHVTAVYIGNYIPLPYLEWLQTEMEDALDQEDYEYAAKIRDEVLYLKLYSTEEFERYIA